MKSQTKKLLLDIWQAGQSIRSCCAGHTFAEYKEERWFRGTVEREFEIIGEARNRLNQLDPDIARLISELPCIVGFGNRMIHGYDTVDDAAVWGIAESHLTRLLEEVKNLMGPEDAVCMEGADTGSLGVPLTQKTSIADEGALRGRRQLVEDQVATLGESMKTLQAAIQLSDAVTTYLCKLVFQ